MPECSGACTETISLEDGWQFRLDSSRDGVKAPEGTDHFVWQPVRVPHTWQSLGGAPEHAGTAWYKRELFVHEEWRHCFVRIEFEAVYHTAHVFLNGAAVGEHIGKGYTAFTCDLSPHLKYGEVNELAVQVDNSFSDTMLPRMKAFDWANDGGIVRPVQLLVTPPVFIEQLQVDATPDLESNRARIALTATIRNTLHTMQHASIAARVSASDAPTTEDLHVSAQAVLTPASTKQIALEPIDISAPKLWHFDAPHLYRAEAVLKVNGQSHVLGDDFGIRKFEARGTSFFLNGEKVSLIGVERMAGSHPQYGMAEPADWIDANHRDMKELNCIFSRVHWPQDKRVLDFCDRHGILMQEEVPAWGAFTFQDISAELETKLQLNGVEQLREMVARDRNHPCIVSWGLCNEVNGKNPKTRAFARVLANEARTIDPARLLTYASNSLSIRPEEDMAGEFDFVSANEYYGSWSPGGPQQVKEYLKGIRNAFPDKPIVVSEYGWCECQPIIPPGDENRVKIVDEHTEVFRASGDVAGAIYFDYNDYRTIIGDKGEGALRERIHGVVDLYANRKPSFAALRRQSSPIKNLSLTSSEGRMTLQLQAREALPAYTLRGYRVRWLFYGYDDLPVEGDLQALPTLGPGESATLHAQPSTRDLKRVVVDILRPTGFSADTAELRL